jgi:hypothetical protein
MSLNSNDFVREDSSVTNAQAGVQSCFLCHGSLTESGAISIDNAHLAIYCNLYGIQAPFVQCHNSDFILALRSKSFLKWNCRIIFSRFKNHCRMATIYGVSNCSYDTLFILRRFGMWDLVAGGLDESNALWWRIMLLCLGRHSLLLQYYKDFRWRICGRR